MKTLTQIEPRTDIATLSGDSQNSFIINQPGSYYLTGNVTGVASKHGISIQASNVTIDLNGFALIGPGGSVSTNGIDVPNTVSVNSITVRNGAVIGWNNGISSVSSAIYSLFERLRVSFNHAKGLDIGHGSLIRDCVAANNSGIGINADAGCTISHCIAYANSGTALMANNGSTVSECSVYGNAGVGIGVGSDCTVTNSTISNNFSGGISASGDRCNINHCTAGGSGGGSGIIVLNHSIVTNCNADGNHVDGINFCGDCAITGNLASTNTGSGFHATGSGNRIDGNQARQNAGTGIIANVNDVIVRNTAGNNGTDYTPNSGTNFGPIQSPNSSTNPMANVVF
jgi:parallel beta-helix repeat protein